MPFTTTGDLVARIAKLLRRDDIDTEIKEWINFFLVEMANEVDLPNYRFVETFATTSTAVNNIVLVQTDVLRVKDIELVISATDSRSLGIDEQVPIEEYWRVLRPVNNSSAPQGVPTLFAYDGKDNKVYFNRKFNTTDIATSVKITGYKKPAAVSLDADVPEVPLHLRHTIVMGAYFYGKLFQEEDSEKLVLFDRARRAVISQIARAQMQKEKRGLHMRTRPSGLENADRINSL